MSKATRLESVNPNAMKLDGSVIPFRAALVRHNSGHQFRRSRIV
jgi:hypothetical protein